MNLRKLILSKYPKTANSRKFIPQISRIFPLAKVSSLKVFAQHGIPKVIISDNGPEYSAYEYKEFATSCDFIHTTSSPEFSQTAWWREQSKR